MDKDTEKFQRPYLLIMLMVRTGNDPKENAWNLLQKLILKHVMVFLEHWFTVVYKYKTAALWVFRIKSAWTVWTVSGSLFIICVWEELAEFYCFEIPSGRVLNRCLGTANRLLE